MNSKSIYNFHVEFGCKDSMSHVECGSLDSMSSSCKTRCPVTDNVVVLINMYLKIPLKLNCDALKSYHRRVYVNNSFVSQQLFNATRIIN